MRALRTLFLVLVVLFVTLSISYAKTNYAYVADHSSNTVYAIDIANNTVSKTITVGTNPNLPAVNQAGSSVLVTNQGSNNVSVISTSTNTVTATIPVGSQPFGVVFTPNGKTAYVGNAGSNSVSVINTGTGKVTATVSGLPSNPSVLVVTPDGAFVYVAGNLSSNVSVISTLTNKVVKTISSVCSSPTFLAISPDGSTVYAACASGANTVAVIRTADNTLVNTISVPHGCYGAATSPDGRWLYVASGGSDDVVSAIDTSSATVAKTIVVGSSPQDVAFTQDSAFAYVTNIASANVSVISTASQTVVDTISGVSGDFGVAVMGTMKVSTVAGGLVGDKGPATSATLGTPYFSMVDSAGNLYISDTFMYRVRKVDTTGKITTFAGTGICGYNGDNIPASSAMICDPEGLAQDSSGNIILADGVNRRVRKIDHTSGKISTIAGTGGLCVTFPCGDGGPAVNAQLGQPDALVYDSAGNLYFSDLFNCVVRKINTSGTISTVAGTGTCGYNGDSIPATTAQLSSPVGVVFDSGGNLYIADDGNALVRKVNTSGTISTFAGTLDNYGYGGDGGLATSAAIGTPRGLTIAGGLLYIANGGRARIRTVDLSSNIINTYAGSTAGYDGDGNPLLSTELLTPHDMVFDSGGNPIFDDAGNSRVRKATGGVVHTIAGGFLGDTLSATSGSLVSPAAIAIDKSGNLYIADYFGNRVREVSGGKFSTVAGTSTTGYTGDGGLAKSATLHWPQGVAVDSLGNVFIADTINRVIREVSSGNITTFATNANFSYLLQMTTDSSNNVYVADGGACVIWKVTPSAVVTIAAGVLNTCGYNGDGIAATTAQLNFPYGVTFDASGNMFIADNGNARIREVTSGTISTIAGDGNCNYTGEGGSATAAEVCPYSVAVDKSGTLYEADANGRIGEIKGGMLTTLAGSGFFGFNGDGLWPLYTTLIPIAVAVDSKGAVYEAGSFDRRVRKIQ